MRQKIRFEKNLKAGLLTILESSEVDPGVVMPLLEEEYDLEQMIRVSAEGSDAFKQELRRKTFFPTSDMCEKLYERTKDFLKNEDEINIVIDYDDSEAFPKEEKFKLEDDDVEIDQILEEDGDSNEDEIKEIDSGNDALPFTPEDISEHEN
ncbi:MAG: hypothetical protein MI862_20370 [Desulfobacterales bacterium]|nr:hypothetical protein [Desulfobacterales bacterium]